MITDSQRLLSEAKSIVLELKKEERRSINPYASFADQVAALIHRGAIGGKEDVLRLTRLSYSRPRLNRQWRTFGRILEKTLHPHNDPETLRQLFGYLKRLLTIEGKKEFDEKDKGKQHRGSWDSKNHRRQFKRR